MGVIVSQCVDIADMILDCFDMHWKLHLPFFNKSETLRELYEQKMATNGQTENQTEVCVFRL